MAFKIVLDNIPDDIAKRIIQKQAELKIKHKKNISMAAALYALIAELTEKLEDTTV